MKKINQSSFDEEENFFGKSTSVEPSAVMPCYLRSIED